MFEVLVGLSQCAQHGKFGGMKRYVKSDDELKTTTHLKRDSCAHMTIQKNADTDHKAAVMVTVAVTLISGTIA